jgi:hypothetical protein
MKNLKVVFVFLFLSAHCYILAEERSERNLNLGWVGFLNLPSKIKKDGKEIKIKTPKMWKEWSEKKEHGIDWFAKPQQDYQQKIKFYLMLEQTKDPKGKRTRRWEHLNK